MKRRVRAPHISCVICSVLAVNISSAQVSSTTPTPSYPTKSMRILVGFAPGGGTDVTARLFAQKFSEAMGQTVLVDNRAGAGGNIATDLTAKAVPDGYTLLMTVSSHAINVSLYRKLPYDPVKDFAPISVVAVAPNILTAHPSVPVASLRGLVTLAKAKPGEVSYGSPGSGTAQHLAMELFRSMAGIQLVHVPYNGGGPSTIAALGGQVPLLASSLPTALPHVRSGKLKALGVTSAQRSPLAPDLPTVTEAGGLPGYEATVWYGMLAPAATPVPIINKLNAEIERLLRLRDVQERLITLGFEPHRNTPQEFAQLIKSDIVKWAKVVRESGAKVD